MLSKTTHQMQKNIKDGIRNIVKGHLVGQHGEMMNSDKSDVLALEITESIERYMDNLLGDYAQKSD